MLCDGRFRVCPDIDAFVPSQDDRGKVARSFVQTSNGRRLLAAASDLKTERHMRSYTRRFVGAIVIASLLSLALVPSVAFAVPGHTAGWGGAGVVGGG